MTWDTCFLAGAVFALAVFALAAFAGAGAAREGFGRGQSPGRQLRTIPGDADLPLPMITSVRECAV